MGYKFKQYQLKIISQKNQITTKNRGELDENKAKEGYLYAPFCQKHFSNHEHQTSLAMQNLFTMILLLTFAFSSKCRMNRTTSCKNKRRDQLKTNTPLPVKTKRRSIIASAIALRLLTKAFVLEQFTWEIST